MRKVILSFFLLLFSLLSFSLEWIPIISENPQEPDVSLINGNLNETHIVVTIYGFYRDEIAIDGEKYNIVYFPRNRNLEERGNPSLPFIPITLAIADKGNIEVESKGIDKFNFKIGKYVPAKGHFTRNIDPDSVPYSFSEVYNRDEFYPEYLAKEKEPFILRNLRGITLIVTPLRYNPVSEELEINPFVEIKVKNIGGIGFNAIQDFQKVKESKEFEFIYKKRFLNYDLIKSYVPISEVGNLLIITNDNFYDEMLPLVYWKKQKGIPTEIKKLSQIGSTADDIKTYVTNYYYSNGLTYLLLVGDANEMPYLTGTVGNVVGQASDPRYGLITGNDNYPEIFVSRFPAQNVTQVQTMVNRVINYEKYPQASGSFYHKAFGIAGDDVGGTPPLADYERMNLLRDKLKYPSYNYTVFDEIYHSSATDAMVFNSVNDGRGLGLYIGHGAETYWVTTGFDVNDVYNLNNINTIPLILDVACVNGKFNRSGGDCFAEAWLKVGTPQSPKGALAIYASSTNQDWVPPCDAQSKSVDFIVEENYHTVGAICINGCMAAMDMWDSTTGGQLYQQWHIFGDGSAMIFTNTPQEMNVSHEGVLPIGANTYQVTVLGVPNALVSLYSDEEKLIYGKAFTDNNGEALINLDIIPQEPKTLMLTVTAFNRIPYIGTVQVFSPAGPFLVFNGITQFTQVEGNNDQFFDKGEKWKIRVSVKNVGSENASGVTVRLTSDFATICGSLRNFGDILVNSSKEEEYEIIVPTTVECGQRVYFNLVEKRCVNGSQCGFDQMNVAYIQVGKKIDQSISTIEISPAFEDTYIDQQYPSNNYGNSSNIFVQNSYTQAKRTLIKFDLSSIPQNVKIVEAKLHLYCYLTPPSGGVSQTLNVHRITQNWTEINATWSNMKNAYDTSVVASIDGGKTIGWKIWDLTTIIENFVKGSYPNYGLMIKCGSETSTNTSYKYGFYSSNYLSDLSLRPKLVVTYLVEERWECNYLHDSTCSLEPPLEISDGSTLENALRVDESGILIWNGGNGIINGYRVYRGKYLDLPKLLNEEEDFCLLYEGLNTFFDLSLENPADDEFRCNYYLVVAFNDGGEGSAGNSSFGIRKLNQNGLCY